MNRISILVVIDKLSVDGLTPGCIAMNLRDTYKLFKSRGVAMTVCDLRGKNPGADLLQAAGIPVVCLGLSPFSPRVLPAFIRVARDCGARVLHAHGYAAANFGRLAGLLLRLPVVVHEHAVLRVRPYQYAADMALRLLTSKGVAISGAVADFMVKGRCVPRSRIEVVYNGIDIDRFQRAGALAPEACRRHFGWRTDWQLIGSAARFRREKGLHVLLEAAEHMIAKNPQVRFVLAGEGSQRAELERLAERRGLRQHVFFPGFIEDIPRFMRALDVLAIPSLSEGFCFAALEAMAVGTPVAASRVGGLPELVTDGVNGLLCPPGDARRLAATLAGLLRDAGLRRSLCEEGRSTSQKYSIAAYVDRLNAMYRSLCGENAVSGGP